MARLEVPAVATLCVVVPAFVDGTLSDGSSDEHDRLSTAFTFDAVHVASSEPDAPRAGAHYSVDVAELLSAEADAAVYKGTLSLVDGHRGAEVVCKIGPGEALRKEADLYRSKLAPLQGRYVPTFVGLFSSADGMHKSGCLVLTYEGEPIQTSLYSSGIDFRRKVVDALLAVHKAGVRHGDLNEQNIVLRPRDNAPILVGFGWAEDHRCHLGVDIHFYDPQPHNQAVACEELYWACVIAGVWLPATVDFLNAPIPFEWALEGFDALVSRAPKGTDPDLACMHAELTREEVLEWLEERELYDGQPLPVKIAY